MLFRKQANLTAGEDIGIGRCKQESEETEGESSSAHLASTGVVSDLAPGLCVLEVARQWLQLRYGNEGQ
jgi:hypothetical protein